MKSSTFDRLEALAIQRYNGEWDVKKAGFTIHISNHRTNDVTQLTEAEAQAAIDGLEKKLAEMKAAAEAAPVPA